ncbi:MAG: collagenase [Candidatus Marinimicrobia bacterium]|nr:collagenase [Candidatus Neomarinimicrobiota bacterium]
MKNLLFITWVSIVFGISNDFQPPRGGIQFKTDHNCSRSFEKINNNTHKTHFFPPSPKIESRINNSRNYSFEELNNLGFEELIELIVTLEWWEIEGLFEFSDGSFEFYSNIDRMQALFDAVEIRGNNYTTEDALGIDVLVEVIRSGFYLAFYYEELNFLREPEIMNNTIPGMDAICSNPNFGLETEAQTIVVSAFGSYQGIGISSIYSLLASAIIFEEFNNNYEIYITEWEKGNALYNLGNGTRYTLYSAHYSSSNHPEETIFYGEIDPLFNSIAEIGLYGTITDDNEWLINNTVWWNAMVGQFVEGDSPVQFLTDVVEFYGEWTAPSLEAVEMLCYYYDCEYADGSPIDEDGIIESVHDWLLPNRTTFDDGTIIFKTGEAVTAEKIETLYWAMKEVKAQFHRISLNDIPLEQGNSDDSLIAVIYNSPADYQYNNFLYGLGTGNGGIYIESWGTFFTYERTPQESIYTLEDLFRHEYSHYLQGRYMAPGMWWAHPIYDNERLTWFEEGSAEFLAGSTRLNGVQTRKTMVENIAWNEADRMTLAEVVTAQYGNWSFYTYGFAFFDYMYNNRMDMFLEMVGYIKAGDGDSFDILMNQIGNDVELNAQYQLHMNNLKENQDNFTDPETVGAYFDETDEIDLNTLVDDITQSSAMLAPTLNYIFSSDHTLFSFKGELPFEYGNVADTAWEEINDYSNTVLYNLNNLEWNGFSTLNSWFSEESINENNQLTYHLNIQGKISSNQFSEVFGCTDLYANNYNPEATIDNNSCAYYSGPVWYVIASETDSIPNGSFNNPFTNIQSAVNISADGDTIMVNNGTYYESIYVTKNLTFLTEEGADNTIINGNGSNGIEIEDGNPGSIDGFTFINCDKGLFVTNSDIYQVSNCIFKDNSTGFFSRQGTSITLINSLFVHNSIGFKQDYYGNASLIINCTFDNTSTDLQWNPYYEIQENLTIYNSIFQNQIVGHDENPVYLYYCDYVEGNLGNYVYDMEGNITENPLFIDVENGDYNLQADSPCIDAGIADLNNDGIDDITEFIGTAPDMGANEWVSISLGDLNSDGNINVVDIIQLVAIILNDSSMLIIIENDPSILDRADFNEDGIINVVDIIQIVQFILEN